MSIQLLNHRYPLEKGLVAYWKLDEASGTRFDSSGYGNHLTSVSNVGQTSNFLLRSGDLSNATWTKNAATITTAAALAPDLTLTAQAIIEGATTDSHYANQTVTIPVTGTNYVFSMYLKANTRSWAYLHTKGNNQGAWFNLTTGVLGTVDSGFVAGIISIGNGWYRCWVSSTDNAGAINAKIGVSNADHVFSYAGDGTSGIYVWPNAQVENGFSVTTYIATTSSSATNSPGFQGIQGNGAYFVESSSQYLSINSNSSLQMNGTAFSFCCWFKFTSLIGTPVILSKWKNTINAKEYSLILQSSPRTLEFSTTTDGIGTGAARSNVFASNFGTPALNTWHFVYCQYDLTNIGISVDNTAMQTAAASSVVSGSAPFEIGWNNNAAEFFDGMIDEVSVWKRILTSNEIAYLYRNGIGRTYPFR